MTFDLGNRGRQMHSNLICLVALRFLHGGRLSNGVVLRDLKDPVNVAATCCVFRLPFLSK